MGLIEVLALVSTASLFIISLLGVYQMGYRKGAHVLETNEAVAKYFNDDKISVKEKDSIEDVVLSLVKDLEVDGVKPNYKALYLVRSSDAHVMNDAVNSIERHALREHGFKRPPGDR